ncbi:MAG: glycosyltransferase family 1 protein, partial [Caldilineae bacterium]
MRLRVTLDIGPAVHQGAGLARYAERLAFHLHREHNHELDLAFFYNAHSGHTLPRSLEGVPSRAIRLGQYPWRLGALASQLLRWPWLESRLPGGEVYHATEHLLPRLRRPTVLTVHDLIFEAYPQHHTRTNRAFLRLAMPLFVGAADGIIAVSHHTRRDLMARYGTPAEKIHVIYEGIDARFAPAPPAAVARVRERYSPDRPYLLMVGTLEPRKNHVTAFRALARLKQQGLSHRLLVVGGRGWLFEPVRQEVERLSLENDVAFTGRVPDEDLPPLYSAAACVLVPSLYEGFGFPVLEAMACGAPVVCSNASSLPEVAGDAALLVDPLDDGALATAVAQVLTNPDLAG